MVREVFSFKFYNKTARETLLKSADALKGLGRLPKRDQMDILKYLETLSALKPESQPIQDLFVNTQQKLIAHLEEVGKESVFKKTLNSVASKLKELPSLVSTAIAKTRN
ncbi:MAG: hypothetical protein A2Y25_03970 [Candidatus Melainabacteria bacterium GWF2_37_15]|nr:MAG: hypothetical protein A2Y25_03970 [Candidatus Melainabacteria bacterium GWF2_37_15]